MAGVMTTLGFEARTVLPAEVGAPPGAVHDAPSCHDGRVARAIVLPVRRTAATSLHRVVEPVPLRVSPETSADVEELAWSCADPLGNQAPAAARADGWQRNRPWRRPR